MPAVRFCAIHLQQAGAGVVQDTKTPDQLLKQFPAQLKDEKEVTGDDSKWDNLWQYDLIIAFDPDWTKLSSAQLNHVKKWVDTHAGGLVVIGGPVNCFQMSAAKTPKSSSRFLDIYPVVLEDNRVTMVERTTTEPFRFNFPGASAKDEYLKLDDEADPKDPNSIRPAVRLCQKDKSDKTRVSGVAFSITIPSRTPSPARHIIATFGDPRARTKEGKEQPYIVTMDVGSGKSVWIGSGEIWSASSAKRITNAS